MTISAPLTLAGSIGFLAAAAYSAGAMAAEPSGMSVETESGLTQSGLRAGDWIVHGRIAGTLPVATESRISVIGGRVETPAAILPDADLTYFVTDHIAIEGQVGAVRTRPVIRDSLVGDLAIGSIWNGAVSGILQYHFLPAAKLNPFLGIGINATTPLAVTPNRGIPAFTISSQVSPVLQAGFDYHLTGNWFANATVKYVFVPPQSYDIAGVQAQADLNMLIVGAGLGYRF